MFDFADSVAEPEPSDRYRKTGERKKHYFHYAAAIDPTPGLLRLCGKDLSVAVHESSPSGFSIQLKPLEAGKLRLGPRWVLQTDGSRYEVYPQWLHCGADGSVQVGLRLMQSLPPLATNGRFWSIGQVVSLARNANVAILATITTLASTLAWAFWRFG
jgi:hypothetical protein